MRPPLGSEIDTAPDERDAVSVRRAIEYDVAVVADGKAMLYGKRAT